jgi:hypothetical protein
MYEEVVPILESNSDVYADMPVLADAVNELKTLIEQIKNRDLNFIEQTKGETKQKLELEEQLVEKVVEIANGLFIHAKLSGDISLQVKSKVTKSELANASDELLVNKSKLILESAELNKTELANYRITEEVITAATTVLADFTTSIADRATDRANSIASRTELFDLFEKTDDLINEKLDPMVEMYSNDNTNFVNAYKAARVIKDL